MPVSVIAQWARSKFTRRTDFAEKDGRAEAPESSPTGRTPPATARLEPKGSGGRASTGTHCRRAPASEA